MKNIEIVLEEGVDLSKVLQVQKHDPEGKLEAAQAAEQELHSRGPLMKFAMSIPAFRWVYLKLNEKKGPWPYWIQRTDETRIQVCAKYMIEHYDEEWEITEKLDGQSATFFVHPMRVWGFNRNQFGVCSRKIWLKKPSDSKYWQTARKYNLEEILRILGRDVYIQAEQCGPGIQKNKYQLKELDLYVFNLVVNGKRLSQIESKYYLDSHGLKAVPLLKESFIPKKEIGENKTVMEVVQYMVKMSQGDSTLLKRPREGIVCRLKSNPEVSLKVINPEFKMEQEKDEDEEGQE